MIRSALARFGASRAKAVYVRPRRTGAPGAIFAGRVMIFITGRKGKLVVRCRLETSTIVFHTGKGEKSPYFTAILPSPRSKTRLWGHSRASFSGRLRPGYPLRGGYGRPDDISASGGRLEAHAGYLSSTPTTNARSRLGRLRHQQL